MKTLSPFLSFWFVVSLVISIPWAAVGQPAAEVREVPFVLVSGEYSITGVEGERGQSIEMKGFGKASFPGRPMLPLKVADVLLPGDVDLASIEVKVRDVQTRDIPGRFFIEPAPSPIQPTDKRLGIPASPERGAVDRSTYGENAFFPAAVISPMPAYRTDDGMTSVPLAFSAMQFNGASGKLREVTKAAGVVLYRPLPARGIREWPPVPPFARRADYVIITTKKIKSNSHQLQNFATWKTQQGFAVRVVTESSFDSLQGPPPNGRAERIREWLKKNYRRLGIKYVLLIGNPEPDDPMYSKDIVGDIPMKQIWHDLPNGNVWWGDATDRYYADLTGNWDADGDGLYGETPGLPQSGVHTSQLPPGINPAAFSVRWTGSFVLNQATEVTFNVNQWQGARLYLRAEHQNFGAPLMDNWPLAPLKSSVDKKVSLPAGKYQVKIEYFQDTGHGHIQARYTLQGGGPVCFAGFKGEYFNNTNCSGTPAASRSDEVIDKNWETSDYVSNRMGVDLVGEVSVGRIPVYGDDCEPLDCILKKTIAYEQQDPAPDWRRNVLVAMRHMSGLDIPYTIGEAIGTNIVEPAQFNLLRLYEDNAAPTVQADLSPCNEKHFRTLWNHGCGMVTLVAHGHWRYADQLIDVMHKLSPMSPWWEDTGYDLLATRFAPFTFQAACHTGNVYLPDSYANNRQYSADRDEADGRRSLAYSLLHDAAATTVGATEVSTYRPVYSPWTPNENDWDNANFAYKYTRAVVLQHRSAGDAMRQVARNVFEVPGIDPGNYHNILIYTLFGDPSATLLPGTAKLVAPVIEFEISGGGSMSLDLETDDEDESYEIPARNFIPKICTQVMDCPQCMWNGLCDDVSFSITGLSEDFAVRVVDDIKNVVAKSPSGKAHQISFAYDSSRTYDLVFRIPKRPGIEKRLKHIKLNISFTAAN